MFELSIEDGKIVKFYLLNMASNDIKHPLTLQKFAYEDPLTVNFKIIFIL